MKAEKSVPISNAHTFKYMVRVRSTARYVFRFNVGKNARVVQRKDTSFSAEKYQEHD